MKEMEDDKILKEHIECLKQSVNFFSNENKIVREKWIVNEFLYNLNINFEKSEIQSNPNDPPDIFFRNAQFELKEIQDEDRKRHREYKETLKKSEKVSKTSELFEDWNAYDISMQKIVYLIEKELNSYKIDLELASKIDMLFYINLSNLGFEEDKTYIFSNNNIWEKWRSVSMVENGNISFVFNAKNNAPDFIIKNVGKFLKREQNRNKIF